MSDSQPHGEDHLTARVGEVLAAGRGRRVGDAYLPLEVAVGDRVLYSARCDTFRTGDGAEIDVVEENSVLGILGAT